LLASVLFGHEGRKLFAEYEEKEHDAGHGGQQEIVCSEGHEAAERDDEAPDGAYVLAFLLPAVHENGKEEGGEHEFDASCVEGE
jgi:hypothetical protein